MRDIALARLTGARMHFLHLSTAGLGGHGRSGPGRRAAGHRRGGTAPLHPHRRVLRRLRRHLQGAPAAADRRRRGGGQGRPGRRVPSTPSPPTTLPTPRRPRNCPSTRRRRECWAWSTPLALALHRAGRRRHDDHDRGGRARPMSWQPAAIAGMADHGRPVAAGEPANLCVIDPAAAGPSTATGGASRSRATCPTWGARYGAGCATRSASANRSCSTGRLTDEPTAPEAAIVLADGTLFEGEAIGAPSGRRGTCR